MSKTFLHPHSTGFRPCRKQFYIPLALVSECVRHTVLHPRSIVFGVSETVLHSHSIVFGVCRKHSFTSPQHCFRSVSETVLHPHSIVFGVCGKAVLHPHSTGFRSAWSVLMSAVLQCACPNVSIYIYNVYQEHAAISELMASPVMYAKRNRLCMLTFPASGDNNEVWGPKKLIVPKQFSSGSHMPFFLHHLPDEKCIQHYRSITLL